MQEANLSAHRKRFSFPDIRSPRHGASSGWGWRSQPRDTEGSCEYIELPVVESPTKGGPPACGLGEGLNNSSP